MRKIVVATAVVVAVVVVWWVVTGSEDEAPIRVRNGSMTIETDGEWMEDGGAWSNETGKKEHKGDLWVRVDRMDGTTICKGTGRPVQIEYSAGGFNALFNVVGNPPRTKVSPKGQLTKETPKLLRHGSTGGYITGVRINGTVLQCDITQNNLKVINICSSPDVSDCQ